MLHPLPKPVLLVLFFLLMVVPSLQAAEPREEIRSGRSGSNALVSWGFLADLWEVFSRVWSENGCEVDPDGRCPSHQGAVAAADNGCWVDPSGGCHH